MYNNFLSGASVIEHLAAFTFVAPVIFTGISILLSFWDLSGCIMLLHSLASGVGWKLYIT